MEKLIIKNFGPIRNAEIEIKKINVLIGHTASGKSTVAKLISIFNGINFFSISNDILDKFHRNVELHPILSEDEEYRMSIESLIYECFKKFQLLLELYNIDFKFNDDTEIEYFKDDLSRKITNNKFEIYYKGHELYSPEVQEIIIRNPDTEYQSIYIPAERSLIAIYTNNIYSLIKNNIDIPGCIVEFGSLYEKSRNRFKTLDIPFIKGMQVKFSKESNDCIEINDSTQIKFSQASTGLQSLIPLLTVFDCYSNTERIESNIIIIEEPELNLFPTIQKELVEYTVEKINADHHKIVYTTHSPYILSTLDNLILAHNVGQKNPVKVERILPRSKWVDFQDLSSYFFTFEGKIENILDIETQTIGAEWIDSVSNILGDEFDKLLTLK